MLHKGGEEEKREEEKEEFGRSKYQELEGSGMLRGKDKATRPNSTRALSELLGQDYVEHRAEVSVDDAEQDHHSEGKEREN